MTNILRAQEVQAIIGAKARLSILLSLVKDILEDPMREDFTASDMEYWEPVHDRIKEAVQNSERYKLLCKFISMQDLEIIMSRKNPLVDNDYQYRVDDFLDRRLNESTSL